MAVNQSNLDQSRRQGSGFTNLQKIMQANTGNRLGQAVGQGIQQAGQETRQGLQQAQSDFGTQSEAGRLDTDQNKEKVQNVLNDAGNATDQDVAQFGKFRAGQYAGPQNLQNIENLQGQAQEANQLGQATGSQEGRQGLLQRFAAAPGQYGAGQQRLDTLLLGTGGAQPLREARRSVSGLNQQVAGAGQAAQGVAQQYTNLAKGFGQDVTQQTTGLATDAQTAAEQKAATDNANDAAARAQAEKYQQGAANNQLSKQALEQLGLTAGQRTYGANLGQFIGYKGNDVASSATPEAVMNQQEFQKFSNLRKLMGSDTQGYDPTKVGTYQAGQVTYDKNAAQAAISAGEGNVAPVLQAKREADEIYTLAQQRDQAGGMFTPQGQAIQRLITQKYPGAANGGFTRTDWAQANSQTAGNNLNNINAKYGGNISALDEDDEDKNKTIDVNNIQTVGDKGLEKMPTVR